jgi:hypothetical protein
VRGKKVSAVADYRNSGIQNADGTVNIGLDNNNPGDIKFDGTAWKGMADNDGTFVIFADTTWGLRAIAVDLSTKIKRGLNTISGILNAYAPASDSNNVPAYIAAVSRDTGFGPDEVLTADAPTLEAMVRAIVNHEISDQLSSQYISDDDISQGVSMMTGVTATVQAAGVAANNNPITTVVLVGVGVYLLSRLI